jgi:hypothetical protein
MPGFPTVEPSQDIFSYKPLIGDKRTLTLNEIEINALGIIVNAALQAQGIKIVKIANTLTDALLRAYPENLEPKTSAEEKIKTE